MPLQAQDTNIQPLIDRTSFLDLEQRTEKTVANDTLPPSKQKPKTRGVPDPSKSQEETEPEPPSNTILPANQAPIFTVSKRGYKVFSTLFSTPSSSDDHDVQNTEIPWAEFLSAMASVGFSIKSLDGSAWIFAPISDMFHRSIIFHEPHPSSKIPFRTARRFGRRLERAFGWTMANFVRGSRVA